MTSAKGKLFIPNKDKAQSKAKTAKKTEHPVDGTHYATDMRHIEAAINNAPPGLYASLTGPGETTSPGELDQNGNLVVSGQLLVGQEITSVGGLEVLDEESAGIFLQSNGPFTLNSGPDIDITGTGGHDINISRPDTGIGGTVSMSIGAGSGVGADQPYAFVSCTMNSVLLRGEVLIGAGDAVTITAKRINFFSGLPVSRPTVTGSRGGNAALASLLNALSTLGLITDSSTP